MPDDEPSAYAARVTRDRVKADALSTLDDVVPAFAAESTKSSTNVPLEVESRHTDNAGHRELGDPSATTCPGAGGGPRLQRGPRRAVGAAQPDAQPLDPRRRIDQMQPDPPGITCSRPTTTSLPYTRKPRCSSVS